MCSSPGGSSKSTVNKPRSGGLYADMSASARLSFAKNANAADDRKTERLERNKIKLMNEKSMTNQDVNTINSTKQVKSNAWYSSVFKYFY